jgi:hypothetical protein
VVYLSTRTPEYEIFLKFDEKLRFLDGVGKLSMERRLLFAFRSAVHVCVYETSAMFGVLLLFRKHKRATSTILTHGSCMLNEKQEDEFCVSTFWKALAPCYGISTGTRNQGVTDKQRIGSGSFQRRMDVPELDHPPTRYGRKRVWGHLKVKRRQ